MKYLDNPLIVKLLEASPEYRKKEVTLLRLSTHYEIGFKLNTYVKDSEGNLRIESTTEITDSMVMCMNPQLLGYIDGSEIYNQWPQERATAVKGYGEEVISSLTDSGWTSAYKKAKVKALQLTNEVMHILNNPHPSKLEITVSWSTEPMIAKLGDYLTLGGYSISAEDFKAYEKASVA